MKSITKKMSFLILSVMLMCSALPIRAAASYEIPGIRKVQADTGRAFNVKTLDYFYDRNTYFSLRDIAMVLKDTDTSFSLEITKNSVFLNIGNNYVPVGEENSAWEDNENPDISLRRNTFKVNEQDVIYYTMIMQLPTGYYDCFMMAVDLAMILDVDITVSDTGLLQINTQEPLRISPVELERDGYFYGVNSVLAGDATTGEIYYQYQSDAPYPIASTTKLMTCLLAMDAISEGQLTLETKVTISDAVQRLSASSDGIIPMVSGEQIAVYDLLLGTLLPSSNECALCLAESIAGSEEAFVEMMNRKAMELGLTRAIFFNSHGLPDYTEEAVPSKRQNHMSAEDMFRLASYFLKVYPQITDITSLESAVLEYLDFEVRNTNPLLHNLPGVTGLKTGTTNKAGACLVTSLTADDGRREHDLVVIVFGTEDSIERGRVSGLLARYALNVFNEGIEKPETDAASQMSGEPPVNAGEAVDLILQAAKKR